MEITIKKLHNQDIETFVDLIRLFEDVFEMRNFSMPTREHLQQVLMGSDFFVALYKNKVVAGLTAYTLHQYYSEKPLAYIYDLAVDTKYQRQGIGKKLIIEINGHCREKGYEEVFVQADKAEGYAIDFYRSTKPTEEEDVQHFYYTL